MATYKLLVFDWDGTLVDSLGLVIASVQQAAEDLNVPVPTAERVRSYFGMHLGEIAAQLFSDVSEKEFEVAFYRHYTEEKLLTYFFPGALATLRELQRRGFKLAVATNKPRRPLEQALKLATIEDLFVATRSVDDGIAKPDPQMLFSLLDELKVASKDAVMIGDTIFDMQMAQRATVDALAACYGHHTKAQLAAFKPVGFINDIKELLTIGLSVYAI